ncbi:MAG TPA: hypothetical protein VGO93_21030 [Candidatus Xenobia bacterium]|jgi:hypothetical protein
MARYHEQSVLIRSHPLERDDPAALPLLADTIRLAMQFRDVSGMAELAIRYARQVVFLRHLDPTEPLRRGDPQYARQLAGLHDPELHTLWFLLMAWDRIVAGDLSAALDLLDQVKMQGGRLAGTHADYGLQLLQMMLSRGTVPAAALCQKVLPPAHQLEMVRELLRLGRGADATFVAAAIDDATVRTQATNECTTRQVEQVLEDSPPPAGPTFNTTRARPIQLPQRLAPTLLKLEPSPDVRGLARALAEVAVQLGQAGQKGPALALGRAAFRLAAKESAPILIQGYAEAALGEPESPDIRTLLGGALADRGKYDQAIRYSDALDTERRDQVLQRVSAAQARRHLFDDARATAERMTGAEPRAEALLHLAETMQSAGQPVDLTLAADDLVSMARLGLVKGQPALVETALSQASTEEVRLQILRLLLTRGQVTEALEAVTRLTLSPRGLACVAADCPSEQGARLYAEALSALRPRQEGARDVILSGSSAGFRLAQAAANDLLDDGERTATYFDIARRQLQKGDVEGSRETMAEAFRRAPDSVVEQGWSLLLELAQEQHRKGDADASLKSLKTALSVIQRGPAREAALVAAAVAQAATGQGEMALQTLAFVAHASAPQALSVALALAEAGDRERFYSLLPACASDTTCAWQWCRALLHLHPDQAREIGRALEPLAP